MTSLAASSPNWHGRMPPSRKRYACYGRGNTVKARKSSPKKTRDRGLLFIEAGTFASPPDEGAGTETVRIRKTEYTRAKPGRKPPDEHLARIDIVVDLSDEEKIVPPGCVLTQIGEGGKEQVHGIPQKMVVIRMCVRSTS